MPPAQPWPLRSALRSAVPSVKVADSGAGIPQDKQARLFQRFSQIDGALLTRAGGTGLGLAICKGLVEAMGGQIGVDSGSGAGSRFWFSIPAPLAAVGFGVNSQIATGGSAFAAEGSNSGIGFAIPSATVLADLASLDHGAAADS